MKQKHYLAGFYLLIALVATSCSSTTGGNEAESTEEAPAAVPEVTLTKVARADISRMLTLPGVVAALPNRDIKISALVGGRVSELNAAEGDRVTEGQIIARLDEGPMRDELRRAEAGAAQARANLENAKLSLTRNQDLLNRGIAARKEVEDARTAEQVAEAAVQQADAEISLAQLQLSRAQVKSPLSGIVVKRFASVGEQVDGSADQPLLEVANLAEVELNTGVPPEELGKMRAGEVIAFSTGAFPGKQFSGRIVAISAAVDPATNTAQVRIRINNAEGLLRLGMNLSAQIPVETHAKALVVPPASIYRDSEGNPHVYRVEQNESKSIPVQLGFETPDQVEIIGEIAEGDTVILDGGYGLEDEAKVAVISGEGSQTK